MLRSMTAYGRGEATSSQGSVFIELQCLNRKYLEISISLPKEFSSFEMDLRKWVESRASRGKISVKVNARFDNGSPLTILPNLPLARELYSALQKVAKELKISEEIKLKNLLQVPELLQYQIEPQEEHIWGRVLEEACFKALDAADEMRLLEGKAIEDDFINRLQLMASEFEKIEQHAPLVKDKYREKLNNALVEMQEGAEFEDRILREIALFAEKSDVSEEITRFKSHLQQFAQKMKGEGTKGKTLEFILQEMGREINTIGSKAQDIAISHAVVFVKSELERIREQVQNVE